MDRARAVVGPHFVPTEEAPGSAALFLEAWACDEVVSSDSIHRGVGFLWLSIIARPANRSWSGDASSALLLEMLSSDAGIAKVLQALGAPADEARLQREILDPSPAATSEVWTFSFGGSDYRLAWSAPSGTHATENNYARHLWAAHDGYRRLDVQQRDRIAFPGQGVGAAHLTGLFTGHDLLPTDAAPFVAYVSSDSRWDLAAHPLSFEDSP